MSLINYPKSLGVITEYNPFHNGHLYHLETSKTKTQSEVVIAVMSGHFTQRGEPAIANPWIRAEWAIQSGIDLVIELPVLFSTSSAAYFAHGSVFLLNALGVDTLCFGSESGHLETLTSTCAALEASQAALNDKTKSDPQHSYSQHRTELLNAQSDSLVLNKSNDILGIAYLQSLTQLKSKIEAHTIQRIHNDYHSDEISSSIASATAIRKATHNGQNEGISQAAPPFVADFLISKPKLQPNLTLWQEWILMLLRQSETDALLEIHDMAVGLPQRLIQASKNDTYVEFENAIKTKIYTTGRLKRSLCKLVLGIKKTDLLNDCLTDPQYIRILGFNEKGRQFLNQTKATLPIITNGKHFKPEEPAAKRQWILDQKAADLYALLLGDGHRRAGNELRNPPVYIRE